MNTKSIFIFRRDLRLDDNKGLIEALKNSQIVIPIFIFTPEQLDNNKFKSDNCVQFMIDSLEDLNLSLKKKNSRLFYFFGKPVDVIKNIINNVEIDAIYVNMDYTPYSINRDDMIKKLCDKNDIQFNSYEDILLNPVGSIITTNQNIYTKFTPYFIKSSKIKVDEPLKNKYTNYYNKNNKIKNEYKGDIHKFYEYNKDIAYKGGRTNGLKILKNIDDYKDYNKKRNILEYKTTGLSAYNKFGCVSIREVYYSIKKELGNNNDLIKQLYWRDFYYNIMWKYPETYSKKLALKDNYNKIKWNSNNIYLNKWKEGKTGYPIVDACMREINTTGFMHNRGRLIVGSFLVKTLLLNWEQGEKYFAKKLIDYDPAVNFGNWGWVSSIGADSQPFFRIFNPWNQSEKYDPECNYIKYWIPELKSVENKHIHNWDKYYNEYDVDYPKPMVDYKLQKDLALKMYKKALY